MSIGLFVDETSALFKDINSVISVFNLLILCWKQKAWEVAQAPFKNLLMMGFMMWMAGSTVHLFSIGITFSALWQPISALQSVGKSTVSLSLHVLSIIVILFELGYINIIVI